MLLQNSLHIKPLPVVTNWNSPYNTNFLYAEKDNTRQKSANVWFYHFGNIKEHSLLLTVRAVVEC